LQGLPALLAPLITTRVEVIHPRVALPLLYTLEAGFFVALAALTRHFSLPAILVLCALDGTLAITAKAMTRGLSATWLLRRGMLRKGNAILNLGVMVGNAAGPATAGLVVVAGGARTSLLIDAASFVVTALVIATAAGLRTNETEEGRAFSARLHDGMLVMRSHLAVRRLLLAIAVAIMFGSVAIPIEVVFAQRTLHAGASGYGFLLGAWGIGMIAGGAGFAKAGNAPLLRILGFGTLAVVLGYAGLAVSPTLPVACVFSALGGAGNGAGWVAALTSVQERIPLSSQNQLMAVLEGINQVMPGLGFIAGGVITAASSPRIAYAVSAAGIALVAMIIAIRPIERVRLSPITGSADNGASRDKTGYIREQSDQALRNSARTEQEPYPSGWIQPVSPT
ncbi:MAG: MFS transporter, partial [Solirubrobacteraceae bacterium]